ncbi:MAG TPA: lysozyme inhibitor LprI family protein [Variovorax sp.]|nr:lysozyme inhibitor LprI family protein [Variovorax sp.]
MREGVGPKDAPQVFALAKAQLQPRLTDLVTMTKDKENKRITCEATARATLPAEFARYDLSKVSEITGGGAKVAGGELVAESVEYVVQQSYDGQKETVRLRKYEGFADLLAGVGLVKFLGDRAAATAASAALKNAPQPEVVPSGVPDLAKEAPAGTTEPEQQASAEDRYAAADKALNAAYTAARARLDDAGKTALRDEQRAWIKTRDASCSEAKITAESGGDVAGGSAMVLEVAGCKAKLTEARAKQLAAKG